MRQLTTLALFLALAVAPALFAQSTSGALAPNDDTFTHPGSVLPGTGGGPRHYEAIQFNVVTTGTYTLTYTCSGYNGAAYPFQGFFQPGSPITNYWGNGVSGGTSVVVTTNFSVTGLFTIVLTSAGNSATGTWTLAITGPGTLEMGPVIRSCTPNSGSTGGGTSITIDGDFLTGVNNLTVGGSAVTGLTVQNDNTITCLTPGHAAGTVNVVASKPAGFGLTYTFFNGFTYNLTPTAVSNIVRQTPSGDLTNAASVTFRVTFAASVAGLSTSNFTVNTTGVAGASVTGVSGAGTQWDVTVDTGTGDGTLRLDMDNDAGATPTLTNLPFTTGQSYTIDKTAPAVATITRVDADPTTAASVDFLITFNEDVTGVAMANLSISATGVTGTSITGITGTGDTRTVSVDTGSNDGTIRLDLLNLSPAITDIAGNSVQAAFITGEEYTIDRTPPTLAIGAPSVTSTSTGPVEFVVTYTGADTITLAAGDITLNATGTAAGTIGVSGTGSTERTVTISGITGLGAVGISIAADTASDAAGNLAPAAGPSATFQATEGANGGGGGGDDDEGGCAASDTPAHSLIWMLALGALSALVIARRSRAAS